MKARRLLIWIVGVPLTLYALAYAVLFRTTKPIEGVLVDARTGKPVSKALVHANWLFMYPNLVDTSSGGFGHGTVTDEDGRFRIPRRNVTSVFRRFVDQGLMIKHPLYEFLEKQVYVQTYKEYRVGKLEGGVLKLTLPIESLEDKYTSSQDLSAFSRAIDDCDPEFYRAMRDTYSVRYDIEEILATLRRLTTRYSEIEAAKNPAVIVLNAHEYRMKEFSKTY